MRADHGVQDPFCASIAAQKLSQRLLRLHGPLTDPLPFLVHWNLGTEYLKLNGNNVGTSVDEKRVSRTGIRKAGNLGSLEDLMVRGQGLGNEPETFSIYSLCVANPPRFYGLQCFTGVDGISEVNVYGGSPKTRILS